MTAFSDSILSINSADGQYLGYLYPVHEFNQDTAELITKWRNANREWFFDTRPVTLESTMAWGEKMASDSNRSLYLICDSAERPVGTYNYKLLDQKTAQLDNLIKGESGGHKALIYGVEAVLLHHLFFRRNIERAVTETFADNTRVNRLLESVGFQICDEFNVSLEDGIWHKSPQGRLCYAWETNLLLYANFVLRLIFDFKFTLPEWAK